MRGFLAESLQAELRDLPHLGHLPAGLFDQAEGCLCIAHPLPLDLDHVPGIEFGSAALASRRPLGNSAPAIPQANRVRENRRAERGLVMTFIVFVCRNGSLFASMTL